MLSVYDTEKFIKEDGSFNLTTNPSYFARVLKKVYNIEKTYLEKGKLEFYPNSFFYDCYLFGKKDKTSYATHHYAGSWKPDWKIIDKLKFSFFGREYILRKYKKNKPEAILEVNNDEKILLKIKTSKRSFYVLLEKNRIKK